MAESPTTLDLDHSSKATPMKHGGGSALDSTFTFIADTYAEGGSALGSHTHRHQSGRFRFDGKPLSEEAHAAQEAVMIKSRAALDALMSADDADESSLAHHHQLSGTRNRSAEGRSRKYIDFHARYMEPVGRHRVVPEPARRARSGDGERSANDATGPPSSIMKRDPSRSPHTSSSPPRQGNTSGTYAIASRVFVLPDGSYTTNAALAAAYVSSGDFTSGTFSPSKTLSFSPNRIGDVNASRGAPSAVLSQQHSFDGIGLRATVSGTSLFTPRHRPLVGHAAPSRLPPPDAHTSTPAASSGGGSLMVINSASPHDVILRDATTGYVAVSPKSSSGRGHAMVGPVGRHDGVAVKVMDLMKQSHLPPPPAPQPLSSFAPHRPVAVSQHRLHHDGSTAADIAADAQEASYKSQDSSSFLGGSVLQLVPSLPKNVSPRTPQLLARSLEKQSALKTSATSNGTSSPPPHPPPPKVTVHNVDLALPYPSRPFSGGTGGAGVVAHSLQNPPSSNTNSGEDPSLPQVETPHSLSRSADPTVDRHDDDGDYFYQLPTHMIEEAYYVPEGMMVAGYSADSGPILVKCDDVSEGSVAEDDNQVDSMSDLTSTSRTVSPTSSPSNESRDMDDEEDEEGGFFLIDEDRVEEQAQKRADRDRRREKRARRLQRREVRQRFADTVFTSAATTGGAVHNSSDPRHPAQPFVVSTHQSRPPRTATPVVREEATSNTTISGADDGRLAFLSELDTKAKIALTAVETPPLIDNFSSKMLAQSGNATSSTPGATKPTQSPSLGMFVQLGDAAYSDLVSRLMRLEETDAKLTLPREEMMRSGVYNRHRTKHQIRDLLESGRQGSNEVGDASPLSRRTNNAPDQTLVRNSKLFAHVKPRVVTHHNKESSKQQGNVGSFGHYSGHTGYYTNNQEYYGGSGDGYGFYNGGYALLPQAVALAQLDRIRGHKNNRIDYYVNPTQGVVVTQHGNIRTHYDMSPLQVLLKGQGNGATTSTTTRASPTSSLPIGPSAAAIEATRRQAAIEKLLIKPGQEELLVIEQRSDGDSVSSANPPAAIPQQPQPSIYGRVLDVVKAPVGPLGGDSVARIPLHLRARTKAGPGGYILTLVELEGLLKEVSTEIIPTTERNTLEETKVARKTSSARINPNRGQQQQEQQLMSTGTPQGLEALMMAPLSREGETASNSTQAGVDVGSGLTANNIVIPQPSSPVTAAPRRPPPTPPLPQAQPTSAGGLMKISVLRASELSAAGVVMEDEPPTLDARLAVSALQGSTSSGAVSSTTGLPVIPSTLRRNVTVGSDARSLTAAAGGGPSIKSSSLLPQLPGANSTGLAVSNYQTLASGAAASTEVSAAQGLFTRNAVPPTRTVVSSSLRTPHPRPPQSEQQLQGSWRSLRATSPATTGPPRTHTAEVISSSMGSTNWNLPSNQGAISNKVTQQFSHPR